MWKSGKKLLVLSSMIASGEDEFICDIVETYGIINYRELPVRVLAALAVGLRSDSRIRMKMNNQIVTEQTLLLTAILDGIRVLVWQISGGKEENKPEMISDKLINSNEKAEEGFATPEEYEEEYRRIVEWQQN